MFSKEKLEKNNLTRECLNSVLFNKKIHDELYNTTTQGNIHKTFSQFHLYLFVYQNNSTQNTPHNNFPYQSKENHFLFLRRIYSTQFKYEPI